MFSKVRYCQVEFTMTNRLFILYIPLLIVFILNGCTLRAPGPSDRRGIQAIRFDDPNTINLEVNGNSVSERIDALRQFMAFLDNQQDVDFSSGFEQSIVTVRTMTGLNDWWKIDFHLVWPSPTMDNQHFNLVKLLNWTACLENAASGDAQERTASTARSMAENRLLELTKKFAQKTESRVRIVPPAD